MSYRKNLETTETPANRFEAKWIAAQYHYEWEPDRYEYCAEDCPDLCAAQRVAIERGKAANVIEWACVTEYGFDPSLGISARSSAAWGVVRQWVGDWDGNWIEIR